ncbi:MAG TPA: DUF4214 domain-containing protein [Candidatus Competibacteraceae bacterium]|nr:DUF4214 domain-containing protein [Candidatus Competibacteraceae bacterium]
MGGTTWEKQTTLVTLPHLHGLGNVTTLAGGGAHGVALTADGQVWTWGDNGHGQLGDGTSTDRCAPQAVTGVTGVETISAGVAHTLVTQRDGTVWAWGQNDTGQLGDGTADDNGTPKPVKGLCRVGALNVKTPPPAGCPVTVEIDSAGDGGGTVSGGGEYAAGATVTLTATPDANSQFTGWKPEPCAASFTMPAQALTCRATFTRRETVSYPLTVTVNPASAGSGTVSGGGTYPAGATVTLTATPDGFDTFTGWTPTPCAASFTLPAQALTCTATFGPPVIGLVTLRTAGDGAGTVNGGGEYFVGETVSLRAQPNVTSDFVNWSPAPCATAFTLSSGDDLTCIATFASRLRRLEIRLAGDGRGAVSNSAGDYEPGTTITLTATPEAGSQFVGWSPAPCAAEFAMPEDDLTCTATFTAGGPAAALVQHYYQAILGRAADDDGAAYWQGEVARAIELGIDPQEALRVMAGQFFASAEYQNRQPNDTQFVTDLYRTFFNREPDDDGLSYWLGQIRAGLPRNIVLYQFLFSPEFTTYMQEQFGPATSRAEVATIVDFYRGLLGRLPDNDGFAYWLAQFRTAQCQGAAAINATVEAISHQFINLPEYRDRQRTDSEYLQDLYGAFLRRGADWAGFDYWQEQLARGVQTREQIRQAFIVTPEFQGRVQQVIEQGCWNPNVTKFIQISAGSAHTCGVRTDGTVACWGSDGSGQATPPAGIFIQVSAGGSHTCGVKTNGTVTCWGDNERGQAAPPVGTFTQVSAGYDHTCGVEIDGTIVCWGSDDDGQATPPAGTFTQVSTGYDHTCGVEIDGTIVCWGSDDNGQATPPAGTFTQVGAGYGYTCAIKTDSTVTCWGDNFFGQATPLAGTFIQISAGVFYTCGVQTDGTTVCWGDDWAGQATPPAGTFTWVSAGASHTCGLQSSGVVACWGDNQYDKATPPEGVSYLLLGVAVTGRGVVQSDPNGIACGTACHAGYAAYMVITLTAISTDDTRFVRWEGGCQGVSPTCTVTMSQTQTVTAIFTSASNSPYAQVSAGGSYVCGVKTDGAVACWGANRDGTATPPNGTFTQVSAGVSHTCGIRTDGTVACWGRNNDAEAMPPIGTFTKVSAGGSHTCGIKTDGTVTCWGYNHDGQATPPNGTFTQVSAGVSHTCGIRTDGTVACWGRNNDAEAMPPSGTFAQVSAGWAYTCGVQTDGAVACWGANGDGEATPPNGTGTFTQVSAGDYHTCGVQTDGTVECWGNNRSGQATPPAGTFTQVSTGWGHTCGVSTDGVVACWGDNEYGQATPPDGVNYQFLQVEVTGHGTVQSLTTGIACGTDCGEQYLPDTEVILSALPAKGARFSRWEGACSESTSTCTVTMSDAQTVSAVFVNPSTSTFTQVSAGGSHTCGVRTNDTVTCWGDNDYGQATPPDGTFTQVSAGSFHTCGVQTDGTVACWGANGDGQAMRPAGTFTQVSAGQNHTCGVQSDGFVVCWGSDEDGESTPP